VLFCNAIYFVTLIDAISGVSSVRKYRGRERMWLDLEFVIYNNFGVYFAWFATWYLMYIQMSWHGFPRPTATALSDIIKDVEKATRVLGQSQLLRLEVLIETVLRNGDTSLEGVDLMNQASQQLYTFSNKLVVSSSYGEIRGWMWKIVIPERQLLRLTYGLHCPLIWLHLNLSNSWHLYKKIENITHAIDN